ncbi:hypothetical protein CBS101457_006627 [Exobasidium rhododendri]|nr:hypothetical protein CBS101457_006627 [Exobasidium rhododendri]
MAAEEPNNAVTEDEAALYDRQIRLWGLEAQTRIRKAHILVINLDGLTTEAIKNWVLAGISALTIVDFRETTQWHDLSAGFFWREEDVEKDRLPPAAARIQALNPLVRINVLSPADLTDILDPASSKLSSLGVHAVVTGIPSGPQGLSKAWGKSVLMSLDERCRALSIPFYCAGTLGLNGWIFSDLGDFHEYVIERPIASGPPAASKSTAAAENGNGNGNGANSEETPSLAVSTPTVILEKRRQAFVPLRTALDTSWKGLTRAQQRRNRLSPGLFAAWALLDYDEYCEGDSVSTPKAAELLDVALRIMEDRGVDSKAIFETQGVDSQTYFTALETSITQPGEFSPTCAILGGVLSQDILNALGGREEPLVNWFQLEGPTGSGPIHALGTTPSTIVTA